MLAICLKFLRPKEQGFTLIELLVVVIIVGILSAIALPSMLGQTGKARQAEAKTNIGTVNRAQQAYYLEKAQFATTMKELSLDIPAQTNNYIYTLADYDKGKGALIVAKPLNNAPYKGYVGATRLFEGDNPGIQIVLCESVGTGATAEMNAANVAIEDGKLACAGDSVQVK